MMYIHSNNEIDKRINVSKIANNISTLGDNSTAAGCTSRLITVLQFVIVVYYAAWFVCRVWITRSELIVRPSRRYHLIITRVVSTAR